MKTTYVAGANDPGAISNKKLTSAPAPASLIDPEFVDCRGLEAAFGIKRSLAYALLADGKIQGVSLRRRNRVRGKRLFEVDSVRAFLRSQMDTPADKEARRE
jgi:hypothetical protein